MLSYQSIVLFSRVHPIIKMDGQHLDIKRNCRICENCIIFISTFCIYNDIRCGLWHGYEWLKIVYITHKRNNISTWVDICINKTYDLLDQCKIKLAWVRMSKLILNLEMKLSWKKNILWNKIKFDFVIILHVLKSTRSNT